MYPKTCLLLVSTALFYLFPTLSLGDPFFSPGRCRRILYGSIGSEFDIRMHLKANQNKLHGTYFYTKYRRPIRIEGKIDDEGRFVIKEYSELGEVAGTFEGTYSLPDSMHGKWFNANRNRSYEFQLQRTAGVDMETKSDEGIGYAVLRYPQANDTDLITIQFEGGRQVPLYEESCWALLNIQSVRVIKLSGNPSLTQIEFSTHPEGQGAYRYTYYSVIPEKGLPKIIIKGFVSSGKAGWCDTGQSKYSIRYSNNILLIEERNTHFSCSGSGTPQEVFQLMETKIFRTYKVDKEAAILIRAEEHKRSVKSHRIQDDLATTIKTVAWEINEIPLKEALLKYPAVNNNRP